MEGISTQVFHSIHSYWRRRSYQRLEEGTRKPARAIRLGGRRSRNVKVARLTLRLRPRVLSSAPLRLLAWMKNAYVDAMLSLAGGEGRPSAAALGRARSCSDPAPWGRRMPRARQMSVRSGDFERRMMMHIYNSVVEPELPCARKISN